MGGGYQPAPDFHCIVVDLPGHGASAEIPWQSKAETATLVNEIIKNQAPNSAVHLVGLSFGSYVGMQLLSMFREKIDSALFSGLDVLPLPNKWLMNAFGVLIVPFFKTNFFIRQNAKMLKIPAEHFNYYKKSVLQLDMESYWKAGKELGNYHTPENISTINCRTLLLAGAKEHKLILESLVKLKEQMPKVTACTVPDVGHGWNGEKPELFARTVRAWVKNEELPSELQLVVGI